MTTKQPSSRTCFVCGRENPVGLKMDFYFTAPGETRAEISVPEIYEGYPGVIHGGIIAAILDETGGRAHMDDPDRFMVTAKLDIRYRKPVPSETPLLVLGHAGKRHGKVSYAQSEIINGSGEILAEAQLVLVDIPEEQIAGVDMDALGWRVYPDEEDK